MTKRFEACGKPTNNGLPCTLPKGHKLPYHRHRVYPKVTWTIETKDGITVKSGETRVPLNYALTEALDNHEYLIIHVKRWEDHREATSP